MAYQRYRLRSELPNLTETQGFLNYIAAQYAQQNNRIEFQIGLTRFRAIDCTNVVISGSGTQNNIQFRRPGPANKSAKATLQDLTYTAVAPDATGNGTTVAYTTGGTAGAEAVSVVGSAITVQIASGTSTATQIAAAVTASSAAAALVTVAVTGTGSHAQTAPATATLAGGVTQGAIEYYNIVDIENIRRLRTKKHLIYIKQNAVSTHNHSGV